jgi:hypothetical protein
VASSHRWLRVREHAGTIVLETAPDGQLWAEQLETATPALMGAVQVEISGGSWTGTSTSPGEAQFDNVNLPP